MNQNLQHNAILIKTQTSNTFNLPSIHIHLINDVETSYDMKDVDDEKEWNTIPSMNTLSYNSLINLTLTRVRIH